MEQLRLQKSELLSEPAKTDSGSRLSEQSWSEWAGKHKTEIALAAGAIAVAAIGSRMLLNRLIQNGEQAILTGAEKSAGSISSQTIDRTALTAAGKNPAGALIEVPLAAKSLEAGVESRLTAALPQSPSARLAEIAPGKVVPEAYSWGATAPGTGSVPDTRSLLEAITSGKADIALQRVSAYERALQLAQNGTSAAGKEVSSAAESALSAAPGRELSGTALRDSVFNSGRSGAGSAGLRAPSAEWVAQHTVYDAGVSRTSAAIVDGVPQKELLGLEMAPGSRPFIEELVVDLQKAGTTNTFSRHMPGLSRMEMPALSIRRKPPKEPY